MMDKIREFFDGVSVEDVICEFIGGVVVYNVLVICEVLDCLFKIIDEDFEIDVSWFYE